MKIKEIFALYYSATGNTEKVIKKLADTLSEKLKLPVHEIDYTLPEGRSCDQEFPAQSLVIVGTPVYAGRIPNKILPYFQTKLTGNGALAVPVVTFGNRSFDDGLIELRNELESHGFHTIAGAAIPSEHAFSHHIASGRPNTDDLNELADFAGKIAAKLSSLECAPSTPVFVPGNTPVGPYYTPLGMDGKPAVFLKAKPKTDLLKCTNCGICVRNCPMGSISSIHPDEVSGICIKCQSCIRKCPTGAKYFDDPSFLSHVEMLEHTYAQYTENQFFL